MLNHHPGGTDNKHKVQLVAHSFTQQYVIGVLTPSVSLVVKPATIPLVLSLVVSRHWCLHQISVRNAFLHAYLQKEVLMQMPPGFEDP
jgi:hypothetical protein